MKRHSLVLPASEGWEYPEDAYSRLDFAHRHISSSLGVARPFTNGLNGDGKNVQTLWWAELDRLHSMTHAHPPLDRVDRYPEGHFLDILHVKEVDAASISTIHG